MEKHSPHLLPIKMIKLVVNWEGWEAEKTGLTEDRCQTTVRTNFPPSSRPSLLAGHEWSCSETHPLKKGPIFFLLVVAKCTPGWMSFIKGIFNPFSSSSSSSILPIILPASSIHQGHWIHGLLYFEFVEPTLNNVSSTNSKQRKFCI